MRDGETIQDQYDQKCRKRLEVRSRVVRKARESGKSGKNAADYSAEADNDERYTVRHCRKSRQKERTAERDQKRDKDAELLKEKSSKWKR